MNLLQDLPFAGHPTDYLRARLHGPGPLRLQDRTQAKSGGQTSVQESRWREAQQMLNWLYRQMNPTLRRRFAPVFTLLELRTLMLCLRLRSTRDADAVGTLLVFSLWPTDLQRILRTTQEPDVAIAAVSTWLTRRMKEFSGLPGAYNEAGLRGFEKELYRSNLGTALAGRQPAAVRRVLVYFVDLRNLLALYKKLRWELPTPGVYLPGGSFSPGKLQALEHGGRLEHLTTLLSTFPGDPEKGAERIETALLRQLHLDLRRLTRIGDTDGAVADFIWRQLIRARNARLHFLGAGLDRELWQAEAVA